jgi:hypothetical protein
MVRLKLKNKQDWNSVKVSTVKVIRSSDPK